MTNYIVLLRGINVGGHNRLSMADLRAVLSEHGYSNITTYIQSGNVLLSADMTCNDISQHISHLIKTHFGYNIPVVTLTLETLQSCFQNNPYLTKEGNIKHLHVTFLDTTPLPGVVQNLNITTAPNETYTLQQSFIYLHTPDGFAKTKFSNLQFEKKLNTVATTRNWNTVTKLIALAQTHFSS
ncbi:MAG: DUF1697 domain-containing protein [Flavobacteriaceae bacterium]